MCDAMHVSRRPEFRGLPDFAGSLALGRERWNSPPGGRVARRLGARPRVVPPRGEPEIDERGGARLIRLRLRDEHDVPWVYVAMDHAMHVEALQSPAEPEDQVGTLLPGQRLAGAQVERFATEAVHDDVLDADALDSAQRVGVANQAGDLHRVECVQPASLGKRVLRDPIDEHMVMEDLDCIGAARLARLHDDTKRSRAELPPQRPALVLELARNRAGETRQRREFEFDSRERA